MMLSLSKLNALKAEADVADRRAASSAELQERLRQIRIGDAPLMVAYKNLGHWQNDIRSLIEGVLNEFGADMLRIIEMRQEAFARKCKTEAAAKRAQLLTVVAEEKKP